ncbi:MAG: hypothetical protein GY812_12210 [Actinomycetia bacterium]|nr:hypothetical protein [Actinomycetes bacterium]
MLRTVRDWAVRYVFGGGFGATLADRGIDWLADEGRKAVSRDDIDLTRAKLRPGETYTVIARPPATRAERRLARTSAGLAQSEEKLSVTTRRQRNAARRLRRSQRRLDRTRTGTRRHLKAAAAEKVAAKRFDGVMAPSKKLTKVRIAKARVDEELDLRRTASFAAVQSRGKPRVTVYD